MATVEITASLVSEIKKKFNKKEANEIIDLMFTLEDHPAKGKMLGTVGGIAIKELKHKGFRFYFITDGFKLKLLDEDAITDLLLRFVRMSDKKQQQQTIEEIRTILKTIGPKGFR